MKERYGMPQPGSIPACAGEPFGFSVNGHNISVYPRVCGGTRPGSSRLSARTGLSPRVRGNPTIILAFGIEAGSIPACAGEPRAGRQSPVQARVYPRVCGGTAGMDKQNIPGRGLSPRVRGNP